MTRRLLTLAALAAWVPGVLATAEEYGTDPCVVDIHAHTFNLDQLPIRGILIVNGSPVSLAHLVDAYLRSLRRERAATPALEELGKDDDLRSHKAREKLADDYLDLLIKAKPPENPNALSKKMRKYLKRQLRQERKTPDESDDVLTNALGLTNTKRDRKATRAALEDTELSDRLALVLQKALGDPGHGYKWFLKLLLEDEAVVTKHLHDTYPDVKTFVHHLMDMEYPYGQTLDVDIDEHIQCAKTVRDHPPPHTRLQTFVAFDPFRYVLDPNFEDRLKQAIDNGAIGIKFYPPSGYRPAANQIPPRPGCLLVWKTDENCKRKLAPLQSLLRTVRNRLASRAQWQARYRHLATRRALDAWHARFLASGLEEETVNNLLGKEKKGAFLDAMLHVFFTWAAKNNVPIFSHHSPGQVEAWQDYGRCMADPCYWYPILEKHKKLKVILSHSGLRDHGGAGWFTTNEDAWRGSFAYRAYKLCITYENVYCGFGMFWELLKEPAPTCPGDPPAHLTDAQDPIPAAKCLAERLHTLAQQDVRSDAPLPSHEELCGSAEVTPRHNILDKILYGSDWMMLAAHEHHPDLIQQFRMAFDYYAELREAEGGFFFGNVSAALDLTTEQLCAIPP